MLTDYIPDEESMAGMSGSEIGMNLLRFLAEGGNESLLNSNNIVNPPSWVGFGIRVTPSFMNLVAEGWAWLIAEALVAPRPGQGGTWYMLTRHARELARAPVSSRHS
jgi:hypothetical protein